MREKDNTPKNASRILKAIGQLIKTNTYREQAIEMLEKIDSTFLPKEEKILFQYIWGRVHLLKYKETEDIDDLEIANDFLDDMMRVAYTNKVKVNDPRMHFSRAFAKFQLAHLTWEEEQKPWLFQKALHIVETSLRFSPKNTSFLWLKEQLQSQKPITMYNL